MCDKKYPPSEHIKFLIRPKKNSLLEICDDSSEYLERKQKHEAFNVVVDEKVLNSVDLPVNGSTGEAKVIDAGLVGEITAYYPERGYGFIKKEDCEHVFFRECGLKSGFQDFQIKRIVQSDNVERAESEMAEDRKPGSENGEDEKCSGATSSPGEEPTILVENPSVLQGREHSVSGKQLHTIFEELCARGDVSDDVALWDASESLTFSQLNTQANILARVLAKTLADHGSRVRTPQEALVAVMMAPNTGRIASVLACFKLGLAYVPLDPAMSDQRIRDIWLATRPLCLIVGEEFGWRSQNLVTQVGGSGLCLVYFEHLLNAAIVRGTPDRNLSAEERIFNAEDPLALVMYTSGSTGKPKGVPLTHANILNRLQWQWNALPFHCGETVAHKTSFLFIDSVSEVFACLLKGVPLVVVPGETLRDVPAFLRLLQQRYVTRLLVVPSLLKAMLMLRKSMSAAEADLTSLHTVVCSGEPLPPALARDFFTAFPTGKRLVNLYGSTEVCGDATVQVLDNAHDVERFSFKDCMSVGFPLENTDVYLVALDDTRLRLIEEGSLGEVCVSGLSVSAGYWDSSGKAPVLRPRPRGIISHGAPFVDNLFRPRRGFLHMHCTGDIGVIHEGHLYLQGRKDSQVKVRGHRVNAWEIDNVVLQQGEVEQSITIAVPAGDSTRLVCFFTRRAGSELRAADLQAFSLERLPAYLRPVFIELGRLPLQPQTGKLDRDTLRRMYLQLSHLDAGPADPTEDRGRQEMRTIIATSLGLAPSKVRDSDDFFKLGGDSLSAVLCVARLRAAGRSIDVETFSSTATIGDLLAMLQPDVYVRQTSERDDKAAVEEAFEMYAMESTDHDVSSFIARSFTQNEILCALTHCSFDDLAQWLEDSRPKAVESGASIVIRRRSDHRLMAATMAFDYHNAPSLANPCCCTSPMKKGMLKKKRALPAIGAFLDDCMDPNVQPCAEDRWLYVAMLATEEEGLSCRQRLQFVEDLERETIRKAKEVGYQAIETINTSEVTTKICEELNYRLVKSTRLCDFEYEDVPFEEADESERANTMLLML